MSIKLGLEDIVDALVTLARDTPRDVESVVNAYVLQVIEEEHLDHLSKREHLRYLSVAIRCRAAIERADRYLLKEQSHTDFFALLDHIATLIDNKGKEFNHGQ